MALLNTPTAFGLKVAKMEADRKRKGDARKAMNVAGMGAAMAGMAADPAQRSMEDAMLEERLSAMQRKRTKARKDLNQSTQAQREQDVVDSVVRDRASNENRRMRLAFAGGPTRRS